MTVIGFHCSHEQITPGAAPARRPARRARRLHRGDVVGPPLSVERPARRIGLCLVVPRRRPGHHRAAVRRRQRAGQRYHPAIMAQAIATLARCSPAGSGRRWARVRRPTSASPARSGRARRYATGDSRVRRRDPPAAGRRRGQPRRARHGQPRPALDAARPGPPTSSGPPSPRRPPPGTPPGPTGSSPSTSPRDPPPGPRRLPRRRRPGPGPSADPPQLGSRPRTRPSRSPATSGAPTCSGRRWHGTPSRSRRSTSSAGTSPPSRCASSVRVSSDLGQHAQWLAEYVEQGWDELYLHFVGQHQEAFIDAFGEHVLPQLSPTRHPRLRPDCRRWRGEDR